MTKTQVILVAGASSGIGEAAATLLNARGHTVFGTSRDSSRVTADGVVPVDLDVCSDESVRDCVATVLDKAGRIDAVVYSAGSLVAGAVEETTEDLALHQLDAYFLGAHRLVRAVLPAMREARAGRLVLMSSTAAVAAIPFHAVYSASKAALDHYAEALRYEVGPFGIQVACIEGTGVRTGAPAAARRTEPTEAYEPARTTVLDSFTRSVNEGPPPETIATSIVDALESRRMRHRYRPGAAARMIPILRAVLPGPVFRFMFTRAFGLTTAATTGQT